MSTDLPLISIAMTTYNGEKYIKEQINSLLKQTYKNIEIVICDDKSSDNTVKIIEEFAKEFKQISFYKNEENLGFKKNFEKSITLCKGQYVAFCDQDDFWLEDKVESLFNNLKDYDLVCSDAFVTDKNLNNLGYTLKESMKIKNIPTTKEEQIKHLIHHNFVQGASILCKKDFLLKYLPIPEYFVYHDWYFAICAALNNGIKYVDKPTLKYRQHGNNVTQDNLKSPFIKELKPTSYNFDEISQDSQKKIQTCNFILKNNQNSQLETYINKAIKYYQELENKTFYTITYRFKNYKYLKWDSSFIKRLLVFIKNIGGMALFKVKGTFLKKSPHSF